MVKIASTLLLSVSAFAALATVDAQANPGACFLQVPRRPLTAKGLATPYILKKGNCDQTNPNQSVFVEATIFDPATKTFSVYQPLVINEGTKPAILPIVPNLPPNAVIGIWFGTNANSVTLTGDIGTCVNGLSSTDIFGQFAYCNAEHFFKAVNRANVVIPPIGKDSGGRPCPTTRFFGIVDQDQSDNLITTYLMSGNRFAQNTPANKNKLVGATELSNGSDNLLVGVLLDHALGCTPFKARSLMDNTTMLGSLALNEIQATRQRSPVALIPPNDPMVLSNNQPSLAKVNAYRRGVNQPPLNNLDKAAVNYCVNFDKIAPKYIQSIQNDIVNAPSAAPATASNLLTFMGQRYMQSWTNLGCDKLLMKTSAITVTVTNGVATAIQFNQSKPL
ncbi:hypothetical protein BGZ89_007876 [Linnemannia elongata]|nr:hypothetical protein BGZ89_007876 [Linnemannia elongata]